MSSKRWNPPFNHPCGGREQPQVGADDVLYAWPPYLHDYRLACGQPGFVDLSDGRGSAGRGRKLGKRFCRLSAQVTHAPGPHSLKPPPPPPPPHPPHRQPPPPRTPPPPPPP